MKNLTTPYTDAILLEEGYVRPNEAPLWIKKIKDNIVMNYPYKIVHDEGDCMVSTEKWFSEGKVAVDNLKARETVSRTANNIIAITYCTEKDLFAKILMCTAHYYRGSFDFVNEAKYIKLFEKFTGIKW